MFSSLTRNLGIFVLVALFGCADGTSEAPKGPELDLGVDLPDTPDVEVDLSGDDGAFNPEDSYELCVFQTRPAARGECPTEDEVVDFGPMLPGDTEARLVRLSNGSDRNMLVQNVQVQTQRNELFDLEYFRLANDGAITELQRPFNVSVGGSIFVQVTYTADAPDTNLPADGLTFEVDHAPSDRFEIEVPMVGSTLGCSTGTADCEPLSLGCETNILTNAERCGGCGSINNCGANNICVDGSCSIGMCPSDNLRDCDGLFANGCETEVSTSPLNCGGCGTITPSGTPNPAFICPGEAELNAEPTCEQGACGFGECLEGWGDCTGAPGCETNLNTPDNCGGCGNLPGSAGLAYRCGDQFPNVLVDCQEGSCIPGDCAPTYYDLDDNRTIPNTNGCEYQCFGNPADVDVPDDNFTDSNCDGIDGDISRAIFVSPLGRVGGLGTREDPVSTIQAGINLAAAQNKDVYVAAGNYVSGTITLSNGVSLFGGYNASSWARSAAEQTTITNSGAISSNRIIGVRGTSITSPTFFDRITVNTPNAGGNGVSNYGLHCTSCSGLTIKNADIQAGSGSAGTNGSNGTTGSPGSPGSPGSTLASCTNNGCGASGGGGGGSPVGASGGAGGQGGASGGFTSGCGGPSAGSPGVVGSTTSGGASPGGPRGLGGANGNPSSSGNPGTAGTDGSNATNGSPGAPSVVGNFWGGSSGTNGGNGTHGAGGGGGGGGGAFNCTTCNNGPGQGGGGGGGGGQRGTGGTGGSNGGGSFGVFVVNSTGIVIADSTIRSANGGSGGSGGNRGLGGVGGNGGNGPAKCGGRGGGGGNGGRGGHGGHGGHGAGGAGGPSYGVFRSGTTVALGTNTLSFGSSGAGGTSLGPNGPAGGSGQSN